MLCLCLWWCMGVYVLATSIGPGAKRPCDVSTGGECWCGMCMWLLTKIQLDQLVGRWRGGLGGHWWTPNLSCTTSVPLQQRSTFSLWGWLNTSRGYPQRLWSLQPLRYSKAVRTWSWVTISSWPCLSRRVGPDGLQRSLPASTILWFWDSVWGPSLYLRARPQEQLDIGGFEEPSLSRVEATEKHEDSGPATGDISSVCACLCVPVSGTAAPEPHIFRCQQLGRFRSRGSSWEGPWLSPFSRGIQNIYICMYTCRCMCVFPTDRPSSWSEKGAGWSH